MTGPEPSQATADPVTVTTPDDPVGWERVYEGAVLSAVLVTQLSGDFAGPVQAQVSIPFYSADRQRILVPRGARFLGTVQPVRDQDQSRLAVGFHRLVWPDGRWVDLSFHGFNAVGEGALARPGEPPLCLDVRRGRRGGRDFGSDAARRESLRRRA